MADKMEQIFKFIIESRQAFIKLLDGLSVEELNAIPEGFQNNIIWNFGHIVVSTPSLIYVRTGISADTSSIQFIDAYKKDSKPSYYVTEEEIQALKELAISSIERIRTDYRDGKLNTITPFATSTFQVEMLSIEEVIITTLGHDNMHFGYASAQKKLIKNLNLK